MTDHAHIHQVQSVGDKQGRVKIRFRVKALAFIMTVITLSWFFEGWRQVQQSPTILHLCVLLAGSLTTVMLVTLQAYWIYIEEKLNGRLRRRIGFFEKVYACADSCLEGVDKAHKGEHSS